MTGKPILTKEQTLKELKQLHDQVERFQKRAARNAMSDSWWDSILGIQNAVDDAIDTITASEE